MDIDDDKTPGLDVCTTLFFKAVWSVIGDDIVHVVQQFFIKGKLLKQLNATLITLAPKVLVNRVTRFLDKLIDVSQNAFVPGMTISSNFLLAQELFAGYNPRNLPPRFAMKVRECVTMMALSVCVNGSPQGFFSGQGA
ncbi:UNVERIFIED_CONTAM: hypothetical protein Slati_3780600 [Sesamum latifolium]|uniref:Reverse transcriptase domain-containing protein n=1 Tax=Sesamum latifolium TaxID=2727402 RepID=A0AAW2U479_9LAMI